MLVIVSNVVLSIDVPTVAVCPVISLCNVEATEDVKDTVPVSTFDDTVDDVSVTV